MSPRRLVWCSCLGLGLGGALVLLALLLAAALQVRAAVGQ